VPTSLLLQGDVREKLREMAENSVDSIVTDPPYGLGFMGKEWDRIGDTSANYTNLDKPHSSQQNFPMNKGRGRPIAETDGPAQQRWHHLWAVEAFRVLKPGGYLLSFGGSRTYHRMASAIEDAGFEIRDQIMWLYGQGFPKSRNISKDIDKMAGAEREVIGTWKPTGTARIKGGSGYTVEGAAGNYTTAEIRGELPITQPSTNAAKQWDGWGTALKPAHEPIVVARKPLIGTVAKNVLEFGTGAINIDGCRVGTDAIPSNQLEEWSGFGELVRPAYTQVMHEGRWPANVLHDGSEEVLEEFAKYGDKSSARVSGNPNEPKRGGDSTPIWGFSDGRTTHDFRDSGTAARFFKQCRDGEQSADSENEGVVGFKMRPGVRQPVETNPARFFYVAKAGRKDRNEGCDELDAKPLLWSAGTQNPGSFQAEGTDKSSKNFHPTVKPTALMRYLIRLVTPPGGTVLDPFMGSGSTGKAAALEGMGFVGIDINPEYVEIAGKRIGYVIPTGKDRPSGTPSYAAEMAVAA
jgi:DNA modification methylase